MSDLLDLEEVVLLARGRYSTVASARREKLNELRRRMEAIMGYCSRILRSVDDTEFAKEQMASALETLSAASVALLAANDLKRQLDDLRPEAWGEGKDHE